MKSFYPIYHKNYSELYVLFRLCFVVLCSAFGTIGCSTELLLKEPRTLANHAIIVDKAGKPYLPIEDPTCRSNPIDLCEEASHWDTIKKETYLTDAYDIYLDEMITSITKHFEGLDCPKKNFKKNSLLIIIHGGLNDQENNLRASKLAKQITDEPCGEYYPIFVNWNSALLSSYGEHLTSVRQGKTDRWALVTSPTYLASDLGRGLIRAPVVWWSLVRNDLTSWPSDKDNWFFNFFDLAKEERNANRLAATLEANSKDASKSFNFWFGDKAPYTFWKDRVLGSTTTALTYPIKFLSSPWIDALGKSAWENMLRRTDLLFHTEKDFEAIPTPFKAPDSASSEISITTCQRFDPVQDGLADHKANGALSIFLRKLTKEIYYPDKKPTLDGNTHDPKKGNPHKEWSITLVGHSMGAIIVNHILRDFGHCLPIDNIVFMAAASTINSYNDSVFPYMIKRQRELQEAKKQCRHVKTNTQNNGQANEDSKQCQLVQANTQNNGVENKEKMPRVYHLMLHELAETSETNYWDLPPTGSLLVWIDNFLSTPNTPMDRTSGRFTNLMLSLHTTPEEIRPHISIKRFPGGGSRWGGVLNGIPKNHRDFAERFKFWKQDCWKVPEGNSKQEKFQNEQRKHCFY